MQSVNLSVAGIYTSVSDLNGLPPGSLSSAVNVESRYKNTLEPRRGFEELPSTSVTDKHYKRLINFTIDGEDRIIGLRNDGNVYYYDPVSFWTALPGAASNGLTDPDPILAKSRFIIGDQNLYITTQDGVRSLSSGEGANLLRAGVGKGLSGKATPGTGVTTNWFTNNLVLENITANTTNGQYLITNVSDITGVLEDHYISGTGIPAGTQVDSITPATPAITQTGNTTAGSTTISNLASNSGIAAGVLVEGAGIHEGTKVASISGAGPYSVVVDTAPYQTATGVSLTFSTPPKITMTKQATATNTGTSIKIFAGSQVAYRFVFGRVETDKDGNEITRLGAPGERLVAINIASANQAVQVFGYIPKFSDESIEFVQLYRTQQTESALIEPLEEYQLVYEEELTSTDFTNRFVLVEDETPDTLMGASLYAGTDREGISQSNDQPPMAWDMCKFRDFALYGNVTRPSTFSFAILTLGGGASLQVGDEVTISGELLGVPFTKTYTAATTPATTDEFQIYTTGSPSQNLEDTAKYLVNIINYDEDIPINAIYTSANLDLAGQITLEAVYPNLETFEVTSNPVRADAFDPPLNESVSKINSAANEVAISKSGELEAVPLLNTLQVGDKSSSVLRLIPLRDYVVCIKSDGIYKIQGVTPDGLIVTPFDLTTKIIGPDTAVALNSSVWMLSNQGVVSISDGGVDAGKSIPIDDQLNRLVGTSLDDLVLSSFGIGYESDRKYILCLPDTEDPFSTLQYNFSYVTNSWTTWRRNFYTGFIHSNEEKLYVARADTESNGVSLERKTGTFRDYVDEAYQKTIVSVDGRDIELNSVVDSEDEVNVFAGDIIYVDETEFAVISAVDEDTKVVTLRTDLDLSPGSITLLRSYQTTIQWKQVFGDNPAFMRQFSEGMVLFKNARFDEGEVSFSTDFSRSSESVTIEGFGNSMYGLFPWGGLPWGGASLPESIRFYIPQNKQIASYILPSISIRQAFSDFKIQGMAISFQNISQEASL